MAVALVQNGMHSWPKSHLMHDKVGNDVSFGHPASHRIAPESFLIAEVRPRKDERGVDLISDALPFGRLWYGEPNAVSNAVG